MWAARVGVRSKTWPVSGFNSVPRSVPERNQSTEREFDPLFIVPADVNIELFHKLFECRSTPITRVEDFSFQPPKESFAGRVIWRAAFAGVNGHLK